MRPRRASSKTSRLRTLTPAKNLSMICACAAQSSNRSSTKPTPTFNCSVTLLIPNLYLMRSLRASRPTRWILDPSLNCHLLRSQPVQLQLQERHSKVTKDQRFRRVVIVNSRRTKINHRLQVLQQQCLDQRRAIVKFSIDWTPRPCLKS